MEREPAPRASVSPDLPESQKQLLRRPPERVVVEFGSTATGSCLGGMMMIAVGIVIAVADPQASAMLMAIGTALLAGVASLGYVRARRSPGRQRRDLARRRASDIVDPRDLGAQDAEWLKRAQAAADTVRGVPAEALRDRTAAVVVMDQAEWQAACALRDGDAAETVESIVERMEAKAEEAKAAAVEAERRRRELPDPGVQHVLDELDRLDEQDWSGRGGRQIED